MEDDIALLHVYGQAVWHERVVIIGNRPGLAHLLSAVTAALSSEVVGKADVSCADGEGYRVLVVYDGRPWLGGWMKRAVPYTDPIAAVRPEDCDRVEWPEFERKG